MAKNRENKKMIKYLMERYVRENPDEFRQLDKDIAKFEKSRQSKAKKAKKYKSSSKSAIRNIAQTARNFKKSAVVKKAVAKKTIGKSISKKIPYVGAAIIAHDVIKGVSKATCGKRGGKWVSGKCVGTKKTKFKPGAKVKDPISKR